MMREVLGMEEGPAIENADDNAMEYPYDSRGFRFVKFKVQGKTAECPPIDLNPRRRPSDEVPPQGSVSVRSMLRLGVAVVSDGPASRENRMGRSVTRTRRPSAARRPTSQYCLAAIRRTFWESKAP